MTVWSRTNKSRYRKRLIQLFAMLDKPLSHHDIMELNPQCTTNELSNILSMDEAFEFHQSIRSATRGSISDAWCVNSYVLSPIGIELAKQFPPAKVCEKCSLTILYSYEKGKRIICESCYSKSKREQRGQLQ